ncbi:MAG: ArnT family glycosyltransferase [Anaerolineae bacterium]
MDTAVSGRKIETNYAGWFSLGALLVGITAFFVLGARALNLPGLYADEALDALPAMELILGQPSSAVYSLHLGSFDLPLMLMSYVSALHSWYLAVWFAFLGPQVAVLRLVNLCLGAFSLVLTWLFLRRFLDVRIAGLTVLLLGCDPGFIYAARIANVVAFAVLPLSIVAAWALFAWYRSGRTLPLVLAGLCLGLGLAYKILFIWFWLALGLAWLALSPAIFKGQGYRAWLWPWRRTPGILPWVLAAAAVVLGAAPLIAYNLARGFPTLDLMLASARGATFYGVSNRAYLANLWAVLSRDLPAFLGGSWAGLPYGLFRSNPLVLPVLFLAAGTLVYLQRCWRLYVSWKRLAVGGIIILAILLLAPVTVSSLGAAHLVLLWPWPQVLIAAAAWAAWDRAAANPAVTRGLVRGLAAALGLLVTGWSLVDGGIYQAAMLATRGVGPYSDAIYALASDLRSAPAAVLLDWGLGYNLAFLTRHALPFEERYDYANIPGPGLQAYLDGRIAAGEAWYVLHAPASTAFGGHFEALQDAAARRGLRPVIQRELTDGTGQPVILVYRLEALPRLFSLPAMQAALQARLGDSFELRGYDLPGETTFLPGRLVSVTLYWRCLSPGTSDYKVSLHLVGPDGALAAQWDGQPQNGGHPTSSWRAGEVVPDTIHLALPADLARGRYRLYAGMYDGGTLTRLTAELDGSPVPDNRLLLGEIAVH